ncbi:MAG: pyruvate, phosphate dikinase [Lentisphaeria bacterium]|nr:pyruvate, phosphate dikinase [Lentisphaeria bacterium]
MKKSAKKAAAPAENAVKYVYLFGKGMSDGDASMKNLLGGKGANLAEMATMGLPVPAGFTITTECCTDFFRNGGAYPAGLEKQVAAALKKVEAAMGMNFGDPENPLLVSCRSGARSSMPGMMETVLNVGLATSTIPGLIKRTNERFVYDAYRRLIMMYSDVVMEKAEGIEPEDGKGIRKLLDDQLEACKKKNGYTSDSDLTVADLKKLCSDFKKTVKKVLKREFPDDPMEQLWGGIGAVFKSWNGKKATSYRRIENIPDDWGTAVNVQSMVFGNMNDNSATGVAFTRDPATGDNKFYGEWLVNAQGEDVVAGTRTPNPLNNETKNEQNKHLKSMQELLPKTYKELAAIRKKLEKHYKDMLDIEFTIQDGTLYMLQCRVGKRTGTAALNMALDMAEEKLISRETAVMRVTPAQLDELLHPILDAKAEKKAEIIAKGLPAGPGGAVGKIVFTSEKAVELAKKNISAILVREETNPEDVEGMRAATGILTARGGMTSHAALVCRGWGKCCIVGADTIRVNEKDGILTIGDKSFKDGDVISLNGSRGYVYAGAVAMVDSSENPNLKKFMKMADSFRKLGVRANADTAEDAATALAFGAEGIGLFRTEHMFYGKGAEKPLFALRKMILSETLEERKAALKQLAPYVKKDVKGALAVMKGKPVTVRLLDPPLHEFVPRNADQQKELAAALKISMAEFKRRAEALVEVNPMMGHRGVRLGVTWPEITEMQVRAVLEAAAELPGSKVEIMIPVTCDMCEIAHQKMAIGPIVAEVMKKYKMDKIDFKVGTMIEIPRAALLADQMATQAEFFSFGTNDLTQMTFGFSRDDIGSFIGDYLKKNVLEADPFQTLDQDGVGMLINHAVQMGRSVNKNLKAGICGEHGGDPKSIEFCHAVGLNYVSCSPFRVPIARLAAAQAAIKEKQEAKCGCGCGCGHKHG